jgi:hypothetical protein
MQKRSVASLCNTFCKCRCAHAVFAKLAKLRLSILVVARSPTIVALVGTIWRSAEHSALQRLLEDLLLSVSAGMALRTPSCR